MTSYYGCVVANISDDRHFHAAEHKHEIRVCSLDKKYRLFANCTLPNIVSTSKQKGEQNEPMPEATPVFQGWGKIAVESIMCV